MYEKWQEFYFFGLPCPSWDLADVQQIPGKESQGPQNGLSTGHWLEDKQSKNPSRAPLDASKSEQTPPVDPRERSGLTGEELMPLGFSHKSWFSIFPETSSGPCLSWVRGGAPVRCSPNHTKDFPPPSYTAPFNCS